MVNDNLFFIGPTGAGKTSIGRCIAQLLGKQFFDLDTEVERRSGVEIDWIFQKEQEEGFRRREYNLLKELSALSDIVLATGAGVVLSPENRKILRSHGTIIYLRVSLEEQLSRLANDIRRPLLQNVSKEKMLEQMQKEREPLYRELADYTFNIEGRLPIRVVANNIINLLREKR